MPMSAVNPQSMEWSQWSRATWQVAPMAPHPGWVTGQGQVPSGQVLQAQGVSGCAPWPMPVVAYGPPPLGQFMGPLQQGGGAGLVLQQAERPRISYRDIALPLRRRLALSVKEKIWKGEFVDMFSLLQVKPELVQKTGEPVRDLETMRKQKIDKN